MSYQANYSSGKKVAVPFQSDPLDYEEYHETTRRKIALDPEKRLMLAVLEDVVACFQKQIFSHGGKGRNLILEAEEWILEENSDWPFCFENICDALGINPEYLRKGLQRWKETKIEERRLCESSTYLGKSETAFAP